jgi:hypothetical protein
LLLKKTKAKFDRECNKEVGGGGRGGIGLPGKIFKNLLEKLNLSKISFTTLTFS